MTPGSQNYQDSHGAWQPIDGQLVASTQAGYAYQNKANRYTLLLPADLAKTPVKIVIGGDWATFRLSGAQGTPNINGNAATYPAALPGVTLRYSALNDAGKEEVSVDRSAQLSSLVYTLKLSPGLSAVLNKQGGVDIGSASATVFRMPPAFMYDSAAAAALSTAVQTRLTPVAGGYTVTVLPDPSWLQDPHRVWPIVIDPTTNFDIWADCYIASGTLANTNLCNGSTLNVGYDGSTVSRALIVFNMPISPAATIVDASLKLELYYAQSGQAQSVELHQETSNYTPSAVTWNTTDGTHSWNTPGGGGDYIATAQSTASAGPTTGVDYAWPLTSLVQGWVNQSIANDGLLLKAANEGAAGQLQFYSDRAVCVGGGTCYGPRLSIEYFYGLGEQSFYKLDTRKLNDRMHIAVNGGNGNFLIGATDLSAHGIGLNLSLVRTYNSLLYKQGQVGWNWQLNLGKDVFVETGTGSGSWDGPIYHAPDGHVFKFTQSGSTFTPPAGVNAALVQNDSSHWTLTFNRTNEKYKFTNLGDPNCAGCAYQTSDVDLNGNTITMAYDANFRLSTVTDTQNRQLTFTYGNPNDSKVITKITDWSGRQYQYAYLSTTTNLSSYTDANNKTTSFGYSSFPLVNQVTDPISNIVNLGYDSNPNLTSIGYVNSSCSGGTCTYSYAYNGGTSGVCTASGVKRNTVRTDPRSNTYRNCHNYQLEALQTFDGLGHARQTSYTPNADAQNLTDSLSQVFQLSYDSNNNLSQIQAPASASGQTPSSISFSYQAFSQGSNLNYSPNSRTDAQGNCRAFSYDTSGNLTDVYDGQSSGCAGLTGGAHSCNAYQGDPSGTCGATATVTCSNARAGELCWSTDAKGNKTSYAYDSSGNLSTITPASPLGATQITVDSLSRISTVTDGKGQKTTYGYDPLDRIVQILYAGASTCSSAATCTSFSYDSDGNLLSRVDNTGTTSFSYDSMNRLTKKALPDTSTACSGSSPAGITFGYDAADNLTSYCDSGGSLAYGFDAANRLTALAEPGGSVNSNGTCNLSPCTGFSYDNDDRRTQAQFPGGASLNLSYDNSGNQLTAIGKDSGGSVLTTFTYTYNSGTKDSQLRQTMAEADALANRTTTYGYDAFNRLTAATPNDASPTYHYSYDLAGNRCSTSTSCDGSYSYNAANELTASPGVSSWSYDQDGNVTANSAGASLTYNAKNQSTAITYGGSTISSLSYADVDQSERTASGSTSFASSPLGLGISKTSGSSIYFTRDDKGNLIGERTPDGNRWYYLKDGLGSIVAVISGAGTIGNRYAYDPYGRVLSSTGSVSNPFGYVGGYLDSTGLVKFGARYYDPNLGRWTQRDPVPSSIFVPEALDQYSYAANGPTNFTDLSGRFPWLLAGFLTFAGFCVATAISEAMGIIDITGSTPADQFARVVASVCLAFISIWRLRQIGLP